MDKLLTIAEIAKRTGIKESTARFYRDQFMEYIPSVGEGRSKRYRPETAEVLRFIADGYNRKLTAMEIEDGLGRVFPRNIDTAELTAMPAAAEQQQHALVLPEQLQQVMGQMAAALDRIANQEEEITELRKHVADVEQAQQTEAAELRKHVADLEEKHAQQEVFIAETLRKQDDQLRKRDDQLIMVMKEMLEAKQAAAALEQQQAKKSFLGRLFGK